MDNLETLQGWARDLKLAVAPVHYRDQVFYVRELTDEEMPKWVEVYEQIKGTQEPQASRLMVALCISDAEGKPLIKDGDSSALPALPFPLLRKLAAASLAVNGFTQEAKVAFEKKSDPTPTSGGSTSSPGVTGSATRPNSSSRRANSPSSSR